MNIWLYECHVFRVDLFSIKERKIMKANVSKKFKTVWSSEIMADKPNLVNSSTIEVTNRNNSQSCTYVIHCSQYLVA